MSVVWFVLQLLAAFFLILGPLVFIHEFGHFLVAKSLRIGVPVFSIGFGPRLFGFRRGGTDYRVSAIPLGGYVRLKGDEADEQARGLPDEFLTRPKWQRFLVFVAGATFNIILAAPCLEWPTPAPLDGRSILWWLPRAGRIDGYFSRNGFGKWQCPSELASRPPELAAALPGEPAGSSIPACWGGTGTGLETGGHQGPEDLRRSPANLANARSQSPFTS